MLRLFGLHPLSKAAREFRLALAGDPYTPASRFDLSSLGVLRPRLSLALWARRVGREVVLSNLFNHRQTPINAGWSVRRTQLEDFRGRDLTYDSHNGTDLCVPVGVVVVAPAPGRVVRVSSEFNRGGLKVFLDHGRGLVTTSNHLSESKVKEGQFVARGEPIALTGASGIDFVMTFPLSAPHVHFNTWLNGTPVDPFARGDEVSLWRQGNEPKPLAGPVDDEPWAPADVDDAAVSAVIASCRDPRMKAELEAIGDGYARFSHTQFACNYYPTRFADRRPLTRDQFAREARLDLPFRRDDYDGCVFADESGW